MVLALHLNWAWLAASPEHEHDYDISGAVTLNLKISGLQLQRVITASGDLNSNSQNKWGRLTTYSEVAWYRRLLLLLNNRSENQSAQLG